MISKKIALVAFVIFFALSITALIYLEPARNNTSCGQELGIARISKAQLPTVHFGAVTKYLLPKPDRFPNAVEVAPDGSVWFGEQNSPGMGHLYANGTYVEYAWPFNYSPSTTSIWGLAIWNGKVWATDALGAQLVSLDPSNGALIGVKLPNVNAFPYTVTIGPDNSLWFTELYGSKIGRLGVDCGLAEYPTPKNFGGTPTQIAFVNDTFAYYIDAGNATSGLGSVLSFNPSQHFVPRDISNGIDLYAPSGIAISPNTGAIWITQHGASSLAAYSPDSRVWTSYPTSTIIYQSTTLPYFVAVNGSLVWFNEHYANRMAVLNSRTGQLTEYSLSNPPASGITEIDNTLTFALGKGNAWFTQLTANYVGFVDASYVPSFSTNVENESISLKAGSTANVTVIVKGFSQAPLTVQFADSENITSKPQDIVLKTDISSIPSLNGQVMLRMELTAARILRPGDYTILISVTDGLVYQDSYLALRVS
jgi:virginiamycin B lyase